MIIDTDSKKLKKSSEYGLINIWIPIYEIVLELIKRQIKMFVK